MRNRLVVTVGLLCTGVLSGCSVSKPTTKTFSWNGVVAADAWLRLRNSNGDFVVLEGKSDSTLIQMEIKRSSPFAPVAQVKVLQTSDGVIACVVYGEKGSCSVEKYDAGKSSFSRFAGLMKGNTNVKTTVTLPRGVRLDVNSTNGNVEVDARIRALVVETVNGNVSASGIRGATNVTTVNGNVNFGVDTMAGEIQVNTVNGNVDVDVLETLNATLRMNTVNGRLDLRYPNSTSSGSKKDMSAVLGAGGSPISFGTVNGNVTIKARRAR
jgi:Putative adhesin